ncbi:MAG: hypothetical protein H6585_09960 [Flavobacteriales bacterium]|nr:hypothetical protein [Flavobacteriales bacterium]
MIIIHYPNTFKALNSFIDDYNEQQEAEKDKIKGSTLLAAKEIVRIYGASLVKVNGIQPIDKTDLPPLVTNNVQLSHLLKQSTRTVQRHIKKLIVANIITGKNWHGSNSGYELFINPDFLLTGEKISGKSAQKTLDAALTESCRNEAESAFSKEHTTNCPHTYSCNTSNNKTNIIIAVEKPEDNIAVATDPLTNNTGNTTGDSSERCSLPLTDRNFSGYTSGDGAGYTGKIEQKNLETDEEAGKIEAQRAGKKSCTGGADAHSPARFNSLNMYVSLLWLMAKNLLYEGVYLTERQAEIGKSFIRKLYAPVKTEDLGRIHSIYAERISLVAKYISRDPQNRYVQLPYLFFDPKNPNGFVGTKRWHEDYRRRKKEVQAELVLNRQIQKFIRNKTGQTAKQKSQLQVFRECEQTLGKMKDPTLVQRFYAAVMDNQTYKHVCTS